MKILLVTPYNVYGNTGVIVGQTLTEMGHEVGVIDKVTEPIEDEFDMTICWTNNPPNPEFLPKPTVYCYLDDPTFWGLCNKKLLPENCTVGYDYVFTCMKWEGYPKEYFWLPMGSNKNMHKRFELNEEEKELYEKDVIFIGTNRGDRLTLIRKLMENFKSFKLWGNNWQSEGIESQAIYYQDFSKAISGAKIFITEHFDNIASTKDCEAYAIGGALVLNDKENIKWMYPNAPIYKDFDDAIRLARYYLEHEDERIALVEDLQKQAREKFSYEVQLQKILDIVSTHDKGKES